MFIATWVAKCQNPCSLVTLSCAMRRFHKSLLIGLITISWAISQLSLIDHVYSAEHSIDTVCEWCTSHSSADKACLDTDAAHRAELLVSLSAPTLFKTPTQVRPVSPYLGRAPPLFLS